MSGLKRFRDLEEAPAADKKPCDDGLSERFGIAGLLGHGTYGSVFSVQKSSGAVMAVKITQRQDVEKRATALMDLAREAMALSDAGLLSGILVNPDEPLRIGLAMDQYGPRLGNSMQPQFTLDQAAATLKPVVDQLQAYSARGAMHRDVKLANVCVAASHKETAKLIDFSLATACTSSEDEHVVTLWYRAPEVIAGLRHTYKADVWAMGLVLLNVLSGAHFCRTATESNKMFFLLDIFDHFGWPSWPGLDLFLHKRFGHKIKRGSAVGAYSIERAISGAAGSDMARSLAIDLLSRMLDTNPETRATWSIVTDHLFWTTARPDQQVTGVAKIKALSSAESKDCMGFLRKAKYYVRPAGPSATAPLKATLRVKIFIMDHFLYYAYRKMGFSVDTVVKAYKLYCNAVAAGHAQNIVAMMAATFVAATYNEDVRANDDATHWSWWFDGFDETCTADSIKALEATIMNVLVANYATWPSLVPGPGDGEASAFLAIDTEGPDAGGQNVQHRMRELMAVTPGCVVCYPASFLA